MKLFIAASSAIVFSACAQPVPPPPQTAIGVSADQTSTVCSEEGSVIIYFDKWSSDITPEARDLLDFLQVTYAECNPSRLDVYAYGDAEGSAEDNLKLTEERTLAVRDELASRGVSPDRISLNPRGQQDAVRADGTPRPSHRFAEIISIP